MSRLNTLSIIVGISMLSFVAIQDSTNSWPQIVRPAYAQEEWKREFEDICAKTQDAMALGPEELQSLLKRCEKLRPLIDKLDETQRKVYLKRLQMCRDLFSFVLESKDKK